MVGPFLSSTNVDKVEKRLAIAETGSKSPQLVHVLQPPITHESPSQTIHIGECSHMEVHSSECIRCLLHITLQSL